MGTLAIGEGGLAGRCGLRAAEETTRAPAARRRPAPAAAPSGPLRGPRRAGRAAPGAPRSAPTRAVWRGRGRRPGAAPARVGSGLEAAGGLTGSGGQRSQASSSPLPVAVARSNGQSCAAVSRSAAARTAGARAASGVAGPPQSCGKSPQTVLAWRPWLRKPAGKRLPRRTAAIRRSSRAGRPCRAAWRARGTGPVAGVDDAERDERVEQRRTVVAGADHGGEVGGRVAAAARLRAGRAQHARHRLDRLELERVDAGLRHHRVEHQPLRRDRGARARSARPRTCRRRRRRASSAARRARRGADRGRPPCRPS